MRRDLLRAETIDAALHLLDRQVVDDRDLLVCKVDDLELSLYRDGSRPAVTRILTGPAALVPRLSTRSGRWLRARWMSLGIQYAARDVPLCIRLEAVDRIGSAVELSVPRDGLLDRQPPPAEGVELRRMGELVGMTVGTTRVKVLDVRLRPGRHRFTVEALLLGPGRPGSLLGYDRGDFNGPWLVATAVGWLHRRIRTVPWDEVERIDWQRRRITLRAGTRP